MRTFLFSYALNATWQAPLLFLVAMLLSPLLRRVSTDALCRHWRLTLVTSAILPAISAASFAPQTWFQTLWKGAAHHGPGTITVSSTLQPFAQASHVPEKLLLLLTAFYAAAMAWSALRLALSQRAVVRLRRKAVPLHLPGEQSAGFNRCLQHFGLRSVTLLQADEIRTVLTLGVFRPAIVLPAGFAQRVSERDLLAALAHECAHLQRRDTLWSLLLHAITLPIALLPTTHMALRQVAAAREMHCDELASDFLRGHGHYAHSLLRLAAVLASVPPALAPHALGLLEAHSLQRRLMHLTHRTVPLSTRSTRLLSTLAVLVLGSTVATAAAFHLPVNLPGPALPTTAAHPLRVESGIMAGNSDTKVPPVYPPEAKAKKIQGTVILSATIGEDGKIEQLHAVSGPKILRQSALTAVRQWTYKPYLLNGQPTAVQTTIHINYNLQ